jgi:hypothetical protein
VRRLSRLAGLVLLAWSAAAGARHSPDAVHLLLTAFSGEVYDYRISLARAAALPRWEPESRTPPPLRGEQAVAIGLQWMQKRAPQVDRFALFRIELTRTTYINRGVLWHYIIYADAVHGTRRMPAHGMQAVVLMDGSVVEPGPD